MYVFNFSSSFSSSFSSFNVDSAYISYFLFLISIFIIVITYI